MDVSPLLNLMAFALVIERILEVIMFMIPGIERKSSSWQRFRASSPDDSLDPKHSVTSSRRVREHESLHG